MKKLFYILFAVIVFAACANENSFLYISVDGGAEARKDTVQVTVMSSNTFTVTSSSTWCRPAITNGNAGQTTFNCLVDSNTTTSERVASITIDNGSQCQRVGISQEAGGATEE